MEINALKDLLSQMTLEEKVGQMVQIPANILMEGGLVTGPSESMELSEEMKYMVGSILGKTGAEDLRKIQEEFVEKHPHHIPLMLMYDVINGMETIFPIPLAQGCTFSPELIEQAARYAAAEATAKGLHVTFSPMLDLVRDARWGRVMESTGEDPWFNAQAGMAMVRGYQGASKLAGEALDLKKEGNIAGCIKHFAAYGAPEGGRDYDNVELSERTLREDYLPAYQAAVEEGCVMLMTSFNSLNRVPSSGNQWLMRKVLREEMGFDGVVISDYSAVEEMVNHGFAEDAKEAAKLGILAGVDIDMVSSCYLKYLAELVREGEVPESLVDESVWRILKLKNDLGLFENPYKDASKEKEAALLLCEEHRSFARKMAAESFVLLKNEAMLPLKKDGAEKIAFIGPYVDCQEMFGSWSFPDKPESVVSVHCGAEQKKSGMTYAAGCFRMDEKQQTRYGTKEQYTKEALEQRMTEAVETARQADQVVLCLGEHRDQSGEAGSRAGIHVAEQQMELLRRVHAVNENIAVVLFSGRPMIIGELLELSKAVMMVWMPGTEGGNAIADVLFGDADPAGRLSMCIPRSIGQVPIHYNKFMTGRPNKNGDDVCFVNSYIDESVRPLYPYGYGVSYTTFTYSEVRLSESELYREVCLDDVAADKTDTAKNSITASVTVTNTGDRTGTEAVQLYLRDVKGSVIRPIRMLRGVQKVTLAPGESREVSFEITEDMLKFYDIHMDYTSEKGWFQVFVGHDSDTQNKAEFKLN